MSLAKDYEWWGGGGFWSEQFYKEDFTPIWRENAGLKGTQVTSGACNNGDYRTILAIFVRPPAGYVFRGTQPYVVDTTDRQVVECP